VRHGYQLPSSIFKYSIEYAQWRAGSRPACAATVEEQVVDGSRVTSRFVVTGENAGRRVRFHGITISRFDEDGLSVEDWSATDTLGLLRQLGLWRSLRVALRVRS
jgi:predicted ester cyclase